MEESGIEGSESRRASHATSPSSAGPGTAAAPGTLRADECPPQVVSATDDWAKEYTIVIGFNSFSDQYS
jgi:hypothetical protein